MASKTKGGGGKWIAVGVVALAALLGLLVWLLLRQKRKENDRAESLATTEKALEEVENTAKAIAEVDQARARGTMSDAEAASQIERLTGQDAQMKPTRTISATRGSKMAAMSTSDLAAMTKAAGGAKLTAKQGGTNALSLLGKG